MNTFDKMKLQQIHFSIIYLADQYEYNDSVLKKLMKYYDELNELKKKINERSFVTLFNSCIYDGALNIIQLMDKNKECNKDKFMKLII